MARKKHSMTETPYLGVKIMISSGGSIKDGYNYLTNKLNQTLKQETTMENKKSFIDKFTNQLKDWDKELDSLRDKYKSAGSDVKEKYQKQIEELKSKKDEAQSKLDELKDASEDKWESMKDNFEDAWGKISESFKNTIDKLKT
jgi:chromosome segregation ATPase